MEWELFDRETLQRTKTPTGWLVKAVEDAITVRDEEFLTGYQWRTSLTFVPDPNHEWEVD